MGIDSILGLFRLSDAFALVGRVLYIRLMNITDHLLKLHSVRLLILELFHSFHFVYPKLYLISTYSYSSQFQGSMKDLSFEGEVLALRLLKMFIFARIATAS